MSEPTPPRADRPAAVAGSRAGSGWPRGPGVVELPDGTLLRGRGLRGGRPRPPDPEWALHLSNRPPASTPWPSRWLRWPDFRLPLDREEARRAFVQAHRHAAAGFRVEIACRGGKGRTGTALACIAQLAGVRAEDATAWVRTHYDPRAVETPWQRRYVRRFTESAVGAASHRPATMDSDEPA